MLGAVALIRSSSMYRRASARSRRGGRNPAGVSCGSTATRRSLRSTSAARAPAGGDPPAGRRGHGEARRAASRRGSGGVDPDLPTVETVDPEDRAGHLGAPGADEAREPDDLATAKLERDVGEDPVAGQALGAQHDVADLGCLLREERVERAPDHQANDLPLRQLGRRTRRDVPAVAQHGDRVRDLSHLLEAVADEHDRDAPLPHAPHRREEALHLVRRQRCGRLVHDQEPRAGRQRLRNLEQLPIGDAEPAHGRVRAEVDSQLVEDPRHGVAHRRPSTVPNRPRGWRPAKTFSATVRSGNTVGSWYMAMIPSRCAVCGSAIRCAPRRRGARRRRAGRRPSGS